MKSLNEIKNILEKTGKYYVAFVGDSITSCEWVHPNWRDIVIYVLQDKLCDMVENWRIASWGIRGFNFGFDGATTRDVLGKLPEVLAIKPNLIIGMMGGNDPILGVSAGESGNNIQKIVGKIINTGASVVWCTSVYSGSEKKNRAYSPFADETMKVVDRDGLQKIDMFDRFKKYSLERFYTFRSEEIPEEDIKEGEIDQIHPNQLGNAYIAKLILSEAFAIEFDPEKYIKETIGGEKYPGY